MARVPGQSGVRPSYAEGAKKGLIFTGMKRSISPDLVGVAQLQVSVMSMDVHKILSPEGTNTLVDSICLSVSTIAG